MKTFCYCDSVTGKLFGSVSREGAGRLLMARLVKAGTGRCIRWDRGWDRTSLLSEQANCKSPVICSTPPWKVKAFYSRKWRQVTGCLLTKNGLWLSPLIIHLSSSKKNTKCTVNSSFSCDSNRALPTEQAFVASKRSKEDRQLLIFWNTLPSHVNSCQQHDSLVFICF